MEAEPRWPMRFKGGATEPSPQPPCAHRIAAHGACVLILPRPACSTLRAPPARARNLVTACSRGDAHLTLPAAPWQVSIDIDATDRRLRRAGWRRHGWRRLGAQSAIIGGDFVRLPARRPAASPCARVCCTGARGEVKCFRRRLPPRAGAAAPARPRRQRRRRRSLRPRRPRASAWRLDARRRLQAVRRRRCACRGGARAAPGEPERAARWAPRRRWVGPGLGPAAPRRSVLCGVWGELWSLRCVKYTLRTSAKYNMYFGISGELQQVPASV